MNKKLMNGILYSILSIIVLFLPLGILFIIKYDDWIVQDSTNIVAGVGVGLVYTIFIMKGALKTMSPKLAVVISMSIFLIMVWFLDTIMEDLFWVVLATLVGYLLFIVVSAFGARDLNYYKAYRDEKARVFAREEVEASSGGSV